MTTLISILAVTVGITFAVVGVVYVLVPVVTAIGWVIRHVFRFIAGEIGDAFRIVGATVCAVVLGLMVILNILVGRWSAAAHFGRAVKSEAYTVGAAAYRMLIGHPARFFLLTSLTEGLERRLPAAMAAAPTADRPHPSRAGGSRSGQFDGYTIVGSLPGGGSGGKLYIARPDEIKQASFARAGHGDITNVVIKTFSLRDGSSLPQIVRESRALDAAKRLGLVLDHELTDERFFYVMRYVPGESLGLVTQRLHAASDQSGGAGLDNRNLRVALSYAADLLRTLDVYHRGGLWHKDVKPDNIIVDRQSAHLVDFGLVTPLRSAMTLTTHGTEYFRDPEMVRMALKGVKVHQVDGARFDIYAAGAVLFSMIENSFPAHGGLSQISHRCPEALRWIVRRSMTEYDKRYTSAAAMLADLDVVRQAPDPFSVRPADLPSVAGAPEVVADFSDAPIRPAPQPVPVGAGSDEPAIPQAAFANPLGARGSPVPPPPPPPPRARPRLRVSDWWRGGYVVDDAAPGHPTPPPVPPTPPRPVPPRVPGAMPGRRTPAREQLNSARSRAAQARQRAHARMSRRRGTAGREYTTFNAGVTASVFIFLAFCMVLAAYTVMWGRGKAVVRLTSESSGNAPLFYAQGRLTDGSVEAAVDPGAGSALSIRVERPDRPSPRVVVQGLPIEPAIDPAALSLHRILVISDTQPPTPPVLAAIRRLDTAGFILLGNYPGNPAEGEAFEQQVLLEAEAKMTRGVGRLDSPDTSDALSEWVGAHDDLDLLVWFAREGDADSPMKFWLFRAPDDAVEAPAADKFAFETALRSLGGAATSSPRAERPRGN